MFSISFFFSLIAFAFPSGVLQVLFCSPIRSLTVTVSHLTSLRSKRFQAVSEQKTARKMGRVLKPGGGSAKTENSVCSSIFLCYEATRKNLLRRLHLTNGLIAVHCSDYHFRS